MAFVLIIEIRSSHIDEMAAAADAWGKATEALEPLERTSLWDKGEPPEIFPRHLRWCPVGGMGFPAFGTLVSGRLNCPALR